VLLTYFCVIVAQIFFRADSSGSAVQLLAAMVGLHGSGQGLFADDALLAAALKFNPDMFGQTGPHHLAASTIVLFVPIVVALLWVWALPNTQQILGQAVAHDMGAITRTRSVMQWRPSIAWAIWLGVIAVLSVGSFEKLQRFIYFQF
jgi:hypothetical protein